MELWDLLDENGRLTGKTIQRGREMKPNEFHLVVHVWIRNSKGEYLISKRTPNKHYPNLWETTGGSAVAGESSLDAAVRETREELGISLLPKNGHFFRKIKRTQYTRQDFCDIWIFEHEINIDDVIVQEGEVSEGRWAAPEKIKKMIFDGEFVPVFDYIDDLFDFSPKNNL